MKERANDGDRCEHCFWSGGGPHRPLFAFEDLNLLPFWRAIASYGLAGSDGLAIACGRRLNIESLRQMRRCPPTQSLRPPPGTLLFVRRFVTVFSLRIPPDLKPSHNPHSQKRKMARFPSAQRTISTRAKVLASDRERVTRHSYEGRRTPASASFVRLADYLDRSLRTTGSKSRRRMRTHLAL